MRWSAEVARTAGVVAALLSCVLVSACRRAEARQVEGGDPKRGVAAIEAYGCGSCHMIPGITGAHGQVGPPLDDWSERVYIAGQVPNTTDFLIRWIEMPQAIEPGTAMPNLRVTEGEARDIAAYLYTLH
jgi:cytochrome c2